MESLDVRCIDFLFIGNGMDLESSIFFYRKNTFLAV